ncbi:SLC13 family permease [Pseudorhodobacter sp. MZDSW-24AT]|uniref:SLC13 family permease n=1 Tax=Pseudorhodobacter sp. MZDSW-24AT TaxID=2052957 RepID=UPI000C1E7A5B|nr:SLC13 family permease [Pseudorhodobacter sp. MZDSW-24AT]PJF10442.1 SLC13 family permease [Pseudorhodobacter sp. MZDSW-24AT]
MTQDQALLFALFAVIIVLMIWGKIRHDIVAFGGAIAATLLGVVPAEETFAGFAHPAVITVALVLVVSAGLIRTGAINALARVLSNPNLPVSLHVLRLGAVGALLSAVMNNVTALALLMPVDVATARKAGRAAGLTLMALAFATILGGMLTLIGTPPNLIVSTFRRDAMGEGFGFFDFAYVGGIVAVAGLLFVALMGWRFVPQRQAAVGAGDAEARMRDYVAELVVPDESKTIGQTKAELLAACEGLGASLIAVKRRGRRVYGAPGGIVLEVGDILLIEATPTLLEEARLELQLAYPDGLAADAPRISLAGEVMAEFVVTDASRIVGRTARQARLAVDHDSVLLGILRRDRTLHDNLRDTKILAGDILLVLIPETQAESIADALRLLPLSRRETVTMEKRAVGAVVLFALAIAAVSLGLATMPVALGAVVVAYVLLRILGVEDLYEHIDWPVIVLLASLIPLGTAMDSTGASGLVAELLANATAGLPAWVGLTLLMVATMFISDVLNNNATAILAAPVGIRLAEATGTNPDSYLMAVAIAASCAFLTPIGHQNNTIVMGPGGYRFSDYWRMGLPLEVIVTAVGVPAILLFWPL